MPSTGLSNRIRAIFYRHYIVVGTTARLQRTAVPNHRQAQEAKANG